VTTPCHIAGLDTTLLFVLQESMMDNFRDVINSLLQLLIRLGDLIVAGIVTVELWLRDQLTQFGVPQNIQTVILLALAAVLIIGSLRLFGGLIRVAVVLVLILVAIHVVMPLVQH
jgi:hypothetical protein